MKKLALLLALVLALTLCACSGAPAPVETTQPPESARNVEILKNWSFQYNNRTDDYSVFFGLLDKAEQPIAATVDVDVRIVSADGTEVYRGSHTVTEADFSYYSTSTSDEMYLANLRIPASAIAAGISASGTVYFTVYRGDFLNFGEVDCEAYYCLPLLDATLFVDNLPMEVEVKDWDGSVSARIRIEKVHYVHEKNITSLLKIEVAGTKTYGSAGVGYDSFSYKLLDSEGYVVDSGHVFLDGLSEGDKFKDDTIVFYDAIPGEEYTIVFTEASW